MQPFQRGFERIVKGRDVPILPVHLQQLWGSLFSFSDGKFFWKRPRQIPYPVTVSFGDHLKADTPATDVPFSRRGTRMRRGLSRQRGKPSLLHHTLIRTARRHPFHFAFGDAKRPKVNRIQSLAGTIALARTLKKAWSGQKNAGVLLPPCAAGALVNYAASLSGRTSVNLNYTAGRAGIESAARQANLKTVVTNREFLEKAKVELPDSVEPLWIEDIVKTITPPQRAFALLTACFAPVRVLENCAVRTAVSRQTIPRRLSSAAAARGIQRGSC